MFHKLIKYTRMQLKICNYFLLLPYDWPKDNEFPIVRESKWKHNLYRLNVFAQLVYVCSMTVNFFLTIKNMTTGSKMLGLIFLDCFKVTIILRLVFIFKEQQGLGMACSFLKFEQTYPEAKTKKADLMAKSLMLLGMVTSFGLPTLMMAILAVDPCKPPHIGYILFHSKRGCEVPSSGLLRITVLIFDLYMWLSSIAPACYYVFHVMALGLRCLEHYIIYSMGTFRQTRKATFEIKRALLPRQDSESTSTPAAATNAAAAIRGKLTKGKTLENSHSRAFLLYRQVQLLNKLYDGMLQGAFYPAIIQTACFAVIISLYACLKLHRMIPMPGLAFFPLLATDGFSVIFVVKIAAGVLIRSERFVLMVKNDSSYGRKTLFKKVTKSLGKIRIRFGSTNFIDRLTPFVFIDFCLTQTVNLMLLT